MCPHLVLLNLIIQTKSVTIMRPFILQCFSFLLLHSLSLSTDIFLKRLQSAFIPYREMLSFTPYKTKYKQQW